MFLLESRAEKGGKEKKIGSCLSHAWSHSIEHHDPGHWKTEIF